MIKKRMYNVELLRIIAMLLIIISHFWGHGINLSGIKPFTFTYYFGWFMKGISYVAVNIYVIISAYFLCTSKFKIKKLLVLWLEIEFYSVTLYILSIILNITEFSMKGTITAFIPVCSGEYWFATIYIGVFLLYPFLNLVIRALNKKQHIAVIFMMCVLFVVIPNIFFFSKWLNFGTGYGIVWFVVLYFLGGYIRKYITQDWLYRNRRKIRLLAILFLLLPGISRIFIAAGTNLIIGRVMGAGLFYSNNSIIIVPASVLLFLSFLTVEIKRESVGRFINWFAAGSFGVYLIHDNPFISEKLWEIVRAYIHLDDIRLIIEFVLVILSIYVICAAVDLLRQLIFKPIQTVEIGKKIDRYVNELFK